MRQSSLDRRMFQRLDSLVARRAHLTTAPPRRDDAVRPAVVQLLLSLGRGGLETMAVDLARGLYARGVRSVVIALDEGGEHEAALRHDGVEYFVLGGRRFRSASFHVRLARLLRSVNAEVVHTHMFAPLLHSYPAIALARVPRLIHTEHSREYLEERRDYRAVLRLLSARSAAFVVVGEAMRPYYLRAVGVSTGRLHVVPNGVDVTRYAPDPNRLQRRLELGLPGGFLIGTAGRCAPEKNLDMLLRAFVTATREVVDARLVVIGDGEERARLEGLASSLAPAGAIRFLGWRRDLPELLPALDAFALTSWSEGLPLVVLEAMATGLPVITTSVGDLPSVIQDGISGLLCAPGDVTGLAAALVRIAASPALRARLGDAARERVCMRYSHTGMVAKYLKLYGLEPDGPCSGATVPALDTEACAGALQ